MRAWTAPDLPNEEYMSLLKLFPTFVVQNPLPRFPIPAADAQMSDLEQGTLDKREIRVGTGTMWVGQRLRSSGYRGNWWTRFRLWLKTVFC